MFRKLLLLFGLVLLVSVSAHAQSEPDKFELFGGYSYQWITQRNAPEFGQSGWEGSLQYKLSDLVGLVADFDGHYGQVQGVNSTAYTYLFGPQISFGRLLSFPSRISPFAQLLVGGSHAHFTGNNTDNGVAWTFGLGVDYRILPGVYWRVIQAGYEPTYFFSRSQSNARLSTGLVVHF